MHYIFLDSELIFNQKSKSPTGLLKDADDNQGKFLHMFFRHLL